MRKIRVCERCKSTHIIKNGTKPGWYKGRGYRAQMWRCQKCGKSIQGDRRYDF